MPVFAAEPPSDRCSTPAKAQDYSSNDSTSRLQQPSLQTVNANLIANTTSNSSKIPVVKLDMVSISDVVAARLSTSLLGHVLFLKNQVPFPVTQLARIPGGKSTTRSTKQRADLLASFDTLSSHLNTTFTALSTAFARCANDSTSLKASHPKRNSGAFAEKAGRDLERGYHEKTGEAEDNAKSARAFLAILVGPSVGSARARVMFAVDGLEVKVWGQRDDLGNSHPMIPENNTEEVDDTVEEEDDESEGDEEEEEGEESDDDEEEEEEEEEEESDDDEELEEQEHDSEDEDVEDDGSDAYISADEKSSNMEEEPPSSDSESEHEFGPPPPTRATTQSRPVIQQYPSHAQLQQMLHAADRLLSRTLATADADGDGMASEMSPSQTHILIRAPRRFSHPAWIPRQNVSKTMEGLLEEFLEESNDSPSVKRKQKRSKVEGVWITGRDGLQMWRSNSEKTSDKDENEADEMIWWSWDGKILGFADW